MKWLESLGRFSIWVVSGFSAWNLSLFSQFAQDYESLVLLGIFTILTWIWILIPLFENIDVKADGGVTK